MPILTIVLALCGALGAAYGVYFLSASFGGMLLEKKPAPRGFDETCRVAVVIAARNEARVIGKLVTSLMWQRYPRALYDVYVAPNNCTDDTEAVALNAGARILRCRGPVHSKGDVLRQAFSQLSAEGNHDVYCVFDADNLVDPMFLHHVNNAWRAGCQVAQGFRDSKNPFDSWVSGGMATFYWFMSCLFNESRARLGLSCHLSGTGFMVSDAVIRDMGWQTSTLTEDLEFTGLCALRGYKIGWMPEARVYDEQPVGFWDSVIQRRRWTAGSLQCTRRFGQRLLKKGTASSLDIGCLFLGNLLNYAGLLSGLAGTAQLAIAVMADPGSLPRAALSAALFLAGYWAVFSAAAAFLYRAEGKLNRRSAAGILGFPLFVATWTPINIAACLTRPPKWKFIAHTRDLADPDEGGLRRPVRAKGGHMTWN